MSEESLLVEKFVCRAFLYVKCKFIYYFLKKKFNFKL